MYEKENEVRRIIATLAFIDDSEVTNLALLSEDLQFDSLDLAELAMNLEEEVLEGNAKISAEDAGNWRTVADVMATVERMAKPELAVSR